MMDPAPSVEDVAEALWQSITGVGSTAQEVHEDWLVLPDDEKEPRRERAKTAIADWRKSAGVSMCSSIGYVPHKTPPF